MVSVEAVIETQKSLESAVMLKMKEFEALLKASPSDKDKVPQVRDEFESFKKIVWSILSLLRQQIGEVSKSLDQQEARHRSKYLLLCGVPEKPDEDLKATVLTLLQKHLGISNLDSSSLKSCYRLGAFAEGRSRPVVFRFTDYGLRATSWRNKTKLKGSSLVLREFLTKARQAVFHTARGHFGIPNVWTADGNIIVKAPDGGRLRVACSDELTTTMNQFPNSTSASKASAVVPVGCDLSTGMPSTSRSIQARSKRIVKGGK
ncbi:unnamed protein product [Diatraea saccharalis]|uniref:Uncharacterized protein n=1 Tax=Diatraea saccharalis TaxID=40085 RepID=A0A9N9R635_9NEOP|nr:unnamed protein product [Diatraea saccharalis]